jgi:hypothetical protein
MGPDDGLDVVTGEGKHADLQATRSPSESARCVPRHPLIPAELTFDAAEIVEPRLDLDDEEGAGSSIEGKEIDPAVRPTVNDLHLPCGRPTRSPQPAVDIRGASGMHSVEDSSARRKRRSAEGKRDLKTECVGDRLDHRQIGVGTPSLDLRDVGPRDADPIRHLLLRQV